MTDKLTETRKLDHIELALSAQTKRVEVDDRFYYEPLFSSHPGAEMDISVDFLGKKMKAPLWVSSMTGGVGPAKHINQNLARLCREFQIGMGLGSCRVLLGSSSNFEDFNLRPIMGPELPLYANLGIAQIEQLLESRNEKKISDLVHKLDADGLIVHINPLQEWFQPEGDKLKFSPIDTLTRLCSRITTKIIVKEVGQGLGPKSLKALLDLPIHAIELAAFGGTNFSKLELLRNKKGSQHGIGDEAFLKVGHTAPEMVYFLNSLLKSNPEYQKKQIIISGGVLNILDGFYLRENLKFTSVIGQAKSFLAQAENYELLRHFTEGQVNGLKMAKAFLIAKNEELL